MAEKIADIYADVDARTGKYDKKMGRVHNKASMLGSMFGKIGALIAGAFAVRYIVRFGSAMVSASADAEEAANKFDVVFGKNAAGVREWSKEIENSFGGSQTEVENWLSSFQDILVPLGLARGEASELSKRLVTLSGDLGSFQNKKTGDVISKMTSLMMGMHRAGYGLGIVMKQDAVDMRALAMTGKSSAKELTEIEKMMARIEIATDQSGDAIGDWKRTMDSLANRIKISQKAMGDFKITIGDSIRELFDVKGAIGWFGDSLGDLNKKIKALNDEGFFIRLSENFKATFKVIWMVISPIVKLVQKLGKALVDLMELVGKSTFGKTFGEELDALYGGKFTKIMDEREANIKRRLAELGKEEEAKTGLDAGAVAGGDAAAKSEKKESRNVQFGALGDILKRSQQAVVDSAKKLDEERNKTLKVIADEIGKRQQQPILI